MLHSIECSAPELGGQCFINPHARNLCRSFPGTPLLVLHGKMKAPPRKGGAFSFLRSRLTEISPAPVKAQSRAKALSRSATQCWIRNSHLEAIDPAKTAPDSPADSHVAYKRFGRF